MKTNMISSLRESFLNKGGVWLALLVILLLALFFGPSYLTHLKVSGWQ